MKGERFTIPGTGLPAWLYGTVLLLSIGLFLFWGGAFWEAPRGTSHVMRFAVSYLTVIPAVAIALYAVRAFSWTHFWTSAGTIWAVKMVVTAILYSLFAPGTATHLEARPVPEERPTNGRDRAPPPAASTATLAGRVTWGGEPVEGAVVFVDGVPPSTPAGPGADVAQTLKAGHIEPELVLVKTGDRLMVRSGDGELHTAHLHEGSRSLWNRPIAPGAAPQALRLPAKTGLYRLTCDVHPTETALVVVTDHPFAARSDAHGRFQIDGAPAEAAEARAVGFAGGAFHETEAPAALAAGRTTEVELDLATPPRIDRAEEPLAP